MADSTPFPQPPVIKKDAPQPNLKALEELLKKPLTFELAPGTCRELPVAPDETPSQSMGARKRECHI